MAARIEYTRAVKGAVILSPEDREFLIAKLAEILVLDYQQSQVVAAPTVTEGSPCDRSRGVRPVMPKHT